MPHEIDDPKAEFHDIGKLLNWDALGLKKENEKDPHEFEKCVGDLERWGVELKGSAWRAITRKNEDRRKKNWPDSYAWIFVSFADELAAGYGRKIPENEVKVDPNRHYDCLWRSESTTEDPRLKKPEDLKEMIQFLNKDPSWEEAKEKYGDRWKKRAETARPGLNVTTLLSHSEVTGKLARILARMDWSDIDPRTPWEEVKKQVNKSHRKLTICHYELNFVQKPFRARDLGVFSALKNALNEIESEFPDNVLSRFENQIIAVFESEEARENFEKHIFKRGFFFRKRTQQGMILEIKRHGIANFKEGHWNFHFPQELPEKIELPLCENCQMAQAAKKWPQDCPEVTPEKEEEMTPEDLCEDCFDLRERHQPLRKLPTWREGSVVWLMIHLDIDALRTTLTCLHRCFLQEKAPNIKKRWVKKLEVSYPMLVDFFEDYKNYLKSVHQTLDTLMGQERIEHPMDHLWCIQLNERAEVLDIIEKLYELSLESFPKLLSDSISYPIRHTLSISNPKYPFFQHWRFFQDASEEVEIQLVNSGVARFRMKDSQSILQVITETAKDHRASLHKLSAIATISPALAQLALLEKGEHGLKLDEIESLVKTKQLDLQSARILANLAPKGGKNDG